MPLHLLGKKSWNVYNTDNIARVRRDEEAAAAAEEAEEQRMQEVDAQRRLAILRGEEPPSLPEPSPEPEAIAPKHESRNGRHGGDRKPRKRPGEDDTDFEMRMAEGRGEERQIVAVEKKKDTSSAPIVDQSGHIDLFGSEKQRAHAEKNEDVERQKKKKQQDLEDQYKIRLATAAGKNAPSNPWYSQGSQQMVEAPTKDVWGNDDPRRKDRQAQRLTSNDPLAMMKSGAKRVRELKKERRAEREERDKELGDLIREERHKERKERRRERSRERYSDRDGQRRRHRSRSKDGEERKHRHRDDDDERKREHRDLREHRERHRRHDDHRDRSRRRSRSRSPRK